MKKSIAIILLLLLTINIEGQERYTAGRCFFMSTLGTGFSAENQSIQPLEWLISFNYRVTDRFSAGAGTGITYLKNTLFPLFGNLSFDLTPDRILKPFIGLSAGYSFAAANGVNGGLNLFPSLGVIYKVKGSRRLLFQAGYEIIQYSRIKKYEDNYFESEFIEYLNYKTISIKLGIIF